MTRPAILAPPARASEYIPNRTAAMLSSPLSSNTEIVPNVATAPSAAHSTTCAVASNAVLRRTYRARSSIRPSPRWHSRSLLDVEQLLPDGVDHGLHPGVQLELLQDVAVTLPLGHKGEDLELAVGEPGRGQRLAVVLPLGHRLELGQQLRGHRRRDTRVALDDRADRVGDLVGGDLLQEVPGRAGLDRVVQVRFLVAVRQDEDLHVREMFLDLLRRLDARTPRHPHVHQHDVRHQLGSALDRLVPVVGLADHLDVGLSPEDHLQASAEQGMIVGDQDSKAVRCGLFRHLVSSGGGLARRDFTLEAQVSRRLRRRLRSSVIWRSSRSTTRSTAASTSWPFADARNVRRPALAKASTRCPPPIRPLLSRITSTSTRSRWPSNRLSRSIFRCSTPRV